jgi:hypothetical protein
MSEHVEVGGKAEKRWTRRKDVRPAEIVFRGLGPEALVPGRKARLR